MDTATTLKAVDEMDLEASIYRYRGPGWEGQPWRVTLEGRFAEHKLEIKVTGKDFDTCLKEAFTRFLRAVDGLEPVPDASPAEADMAD